MTTFSSKRRWWQVKSEPESQHKPRSTDISKEMKSATGNLMQAKDFQLLGLSGAVGLPSPRITMCGFLRRRLQSMITSAERDGQSRWR